MKHAGLIRKHQAVVNFLQRFLDVFIIFACLMLTTYLHSSNISLSDQKYLLAGILASAGFYVAALHLKLYQSFRSVDLRQPIWLVLQAWFFTVACLLALSFALKTTAYFSRMALTLWIISTPVAMILSRMMVREVLNRLRVGGRNTCKVVLAGFSPQALQFIEEIKHNPWMGYELIGYFQDEPAQADGIDHLGKVEALYPLAKAQTFDAIYIALPMQASDEIKAVINALSDCSMPVYYLPDLLTSNLMAGKLTRFGGQACVSIFDSAYDETGALLKRIEDLVLSSLILLLVSPFMAIIALSIKLSSKGPVLFKQKRYGLAGGAINVYKFRTMTVLDDGVGEVKQASKYDARITPLGHFLRRTSLDELPQFINVLQGRMSVVGPRPHAVSHNEEYRQLIDGYMLRHLVKPGITGWAQVNGWRGETDTLEKMEKRIAFDLEYLNTWSIGLDLKIILLTLVKGFVHKNAY